MNSVEDHQQCGIPTHFSNFGIAAEMFDVLVFLGGLIRKVVENKYIDKNGKRQAYRKLTYFYIHLNLVYI